MSGRPPVLDVEPLAEIANREHGLALASGKVMVEHALRAGQALAEAKATIPHGAFAQWLSDHFTGTQRTAQRYMQLAANPTRVSLSGSLRGALSAIADAGSAPHVARATGEVEWYTPPPYAEAARRVMGAIDLDPASCVEANATIAARRIFTRDADGLAREWHGRVWLNPPYATPLIDRFAEKLVGEFGRGNVREAVALTNNASETRWFQRLAGVAAVICFPSGRIRFHGPGRGPGAPLQGQAIFYLGGRPDAFNREFAERGLIVRPMPVRRRA